MAALSDEYAAALAALPEKRRRFVVEYLVDQNGAASARRAGYAAGSAAVTASKLLTIAKVRAAVDAGLAARAEAVEITTGEVVQELKRCAFADLRRAVKWGAGTVTLLESDDLDEDIARAIVEVVQLKDGGVKIKLASKIAALGQLGKASGLFRETDTTKEATDLDVIAQIDAGRLRAAAPPIRLIEGRVIDEAAVDG